MEKKCIMRPDRPKNKENPAVIEPRATVSPSNPSAGSTLTSSQGKKGIHESASHCHSEKTLSHCHDLWGPAKAARSGIFNQENWRLA
jgi:hypothetical protein